MWVLPDEDAKRLQDAREARAKKHAPTTPRTFEDLLERCEIYLSDSGGEWLDEVKFGFAQSIRNARAALPSGDPA